MLWCDHKIINTLLGFLPVLYDDDEEEDGPEICEPERKRKKSMFYISYYVLLRPSTKNYIY